MKFFIFIVTSSLPPLNGKNPELGGFSIGYVHDTSELTDNQVSSSSPVGLYLCRHVQFASSELQYFESSNFQLIMSILPLN